MRAQQTLRWSAGSPTGSLGWALKKRNPEPYKSQATIQQGDKFPFKTLSFEQFKHFPSSASVLTEFVPGSALTRFKLYFRGPSGSWIWPGPRPARQMKILGWQQQIKDLAVGIRHCCFIHPTRKHENIGGAWKVRVPYGAILDGSSYSLGDVTVVACCNYVCRKFRHPISLYVSWFKSQFHLRRG